MNVFEKKEVGEKLRYNRDKLGYSEGEWAKLWKVSVADIRKWEKGISLPNSKKLDKLLNFSYKKSENKTNTNTKKSKVSKKARTYLITEDQLNKVKKEASDEAFNRMMATMMYLPLKALSKMGWGKVRLIRFSNEMIELLKEVEASEASVDMMKDFIKEKAKFELEYDAASGDIMINDELEG